MVGEHGLSLACRFPSCLALLVLALTIPIFMGVAAFYRSVGHGCGSGIGKSLHVT